MHVFNATNINFLKEILLTPNLWWKNSWFRKKINVELFKLIKLN